MRIGILGVGELSEKVARGLLRADPAAEIYLSPRGRQRAEKLAAETSCRLMKDNQAVVDAADLIIIGVRPNSLAELAQDITLRPEQTLVSLVAGASFAALREIFRHEKCARLMLTFAAEIKMTTVILSQADETVQQRFAGLGRLVTLAAERDFELATVSVCMNGWFYFLADSLQRWLTDKGMQPDAARQLALSNLQDCAEYASAHPARSVAAMGADIASEGTWTAQGLEVLKNRQAFDAWRDAADAVFASLHPPERQ